MRRASQLSIALATLAAILLAPLTTTATAAAYSPAGSYLGAETVAAKASA